MPAVNILMPQLYAMQVLRTEHGLKPDDVEAIEILVNEITDFLSIILSLKIRMAASSVSNIVLPGAQIRRYGC